MVQRKRFTRGALDKQGWRVGSGITWNVSATRGSSEIGSSSCGNFTKKAPSITRRDDGKGSIITADGASKKGQQLPGQLRE